MFIQICRKYYTNLRNFIGKGFINLIEIFKLEQPTATTIVRHYSILELFDILSAVYYFYNQFYILN